MKEGFPGDSEVKNMPAMQKTQIQSLGREESLEEEMATYSSASAWEIPWTEEPGGPQSMGSHDLLIKHHHLEGKRELYMMSVKKQLPDFGNVITCVSCAPCVRAPARAPYQHALPAGFWRQGSNTRAAANVRESVPINTFYSAQRSTFHMPLTTESFLGKQ